MDECLTQKLIQLNQPRQKVSSSALSVANQLLCLLVTTAKDRAVLEAECERDVMMSDSDSEDMGVNEIKVTEKHIHMVAAEILMDFS